ncbi:MAG: FAD binding domain-containing protein [Hyphomicrobiaceae bacterium]
MKPAKFDYSSAAATSDANAELSAGNGGTKLIAGAQSIGPMLNLRLVRPERLIDVSMLPELRAAKVTAAGIEIGAAVTHAEIEDGEVSGWATAESGKAPVVWLREAAANIAHRAVRNRGTLGGSLAHADPAADWVIVMTGLGAQVRLQGPDGQRDVAVSDFVTGPFETALQPGELIASVHVPRPGPNARWGYWKFVRQVGEFAKASATVLVDPDAAAPRIAVGALGRQPLVLEPNVATDFATGQMTAQAALAATLPERNIRDLALHVAALNNALAKAHNESEQR